MATAVDYSLCPVSCKHLDITDQTGLFDATQNPGGWDEPVIGPYATAVYEDKLYITFPDGHEIVIDLLNGILPWPNTTRLTQRITNVALGLGTDGKLPSGKWTIKRSCKALLNDGITQWVGNKTYDWWIICQQECCVAKMGIKMAKELQSPVDCNKPDSMTAAWDKAYKLLKGSQYLFECNDYDGAQRALDQVIELCEAKNCGCC